MRLSIQVEELAERPDARNIGVRNADIVERSDLL
jgi:hypothetical protein